MLLLLIDYLLLNTSCEVPDAIKALTFILSSTVVNAMVNDHVKAIKGMTNELDAEAWKLCVSDISMKMHLHNNYHTRNTDDEIYQIAGMAHLTVLS